MEYIHPRSVVLEIDGKSVISTQITYDELVAAYYQFIRNHGAVPISSECVAKNNLPQMRIIKRILQEEHITYGAFLAQFGKVAHVRSDSRDYARHVKQYIEFSNKLGHAITSGELINNQYGLPGSTWFIQNCPDKNVTSFTQFVQWCGLTPAKKVWTREEVGNALCNLECQLSRPVTKQDIAPDSVGFSMIVVTRLFGSLSQAKQDLGLLRTAHIQPLSFEFYKTKLERTAKKAAATLHRKTITWSEIEDDAYCPYEYTHSTDHKTYMKSFASAGVNLVEYLKSIGIEMCPSGFSFVHTFDDGERTRSNMEYDVTLLLREHGLVYCKDYFRDVKYLEYFGGTSRIDCDYEIVRGSEHRFLEIAGIITRPPDADWRTYQYDTRIKCEYRDKMILKERLLEDAGVPFLFVFANEMASGDYARLITEFIK